MHDGQLEDRLRAALRGEGDALPLTITTAELERRLALRRRQRLGRRAGVLAAAVAIVAVGSLVVTTSGWFRDASVGASAEPLTTGQPNTEPTAEPSSQATEAGGPCTTIEPDPADQPPTVVLGATPGDSIAYGGALGAYRIGERADGKEGNWTSIDPGSLDRVPAVPPTERLVVLAGNPDACLTGVVADAVPLDRRDAPAVALADMTVAPARVIEFAKPRSGEWLVRVHVTFATGSGVTAWTETFFRVDARNPAESLGPVLGNLPILNTPPGTIFLDEHSARLEQSDPTGLTDEFVVGHVQPRAMYIVNIVCLGSSPVRWSIGLEGQLDFLAAGDQTCDGTQSEQAIERGLPTHDLNVIVRGDPASAWRIIVATIADTPSFIPPTLRMIETGNTEGSTGAAEAFGRCISTPDAPDQCAAEWFALDGARSVLIPPDSRLTFGLADGWRIEQARIIAVSTEALSGNVFAPEYSVAFVDTGGPLITVQVPLEPGSWVVRVALNGSRDGESFSAHYDLRLDIEE
jgi:hypothetical protein